LPSASQGFKSLFFEQEIERNGEKALLPFYFLLLPCGCDLSPTHIQPE
jgi:hypothetical protein